MRWRWLWVWAGRSRRCRWHPRTPRDRMARRVRVRRRRQRDPTRPRRAARHGRVDTHTATLRPGRIPTPPRRATAIRRLLRPATPARRPEGGITRTPSTRRRALILLRPRLRRRIRPQQRRGRADTHAVTRRLRDLRPSPVGTPLRVQTPALRAEAIRLLRPRVAAPTRLPRKGPLPQPPESAITRRPSTSRQSPRQRRPPRPRQRAAIPAATAPSPRRRPRRVLIRRRPATRPRLIPHRCP